MDSGSDPSDGGGSGQSGNDDGKNSDASPDVSDNDGRGAPASCDQSGTGEVMGAPMDAGDGDGDSSPSPAGMTEEDQVWDEAMHRALNLAKAEGKAPGGVEEALRGAHASTLDQRSLLRCQMTDAASRDYSWSVRNRRCIDGGLYLLSIRSEGIDAIPVIVDISGSLPARILERFRGERIDIGAR